jgi:hypothetical protein
VGTNFRLQTVRHTLSFRAALACPATAPPMFALAETKQCDFFALLANVFVLSAFIFHQTSKNK